MKRKRSALAPETLREHLRWLEMKALEEEDREGYARHPQAASEWSSWEAEAAWPEEKGEAISVA